MSRTPLTSTVDPLSIRALLAQIGLDEKEVEVYLALLSLKQARASDIAKAAKQSRSHTYLILRELRDKGLASEVEKGKVIHFVAEPPKRLLSYLQDREDEIHRLEVMVERALPQLEGLTTQLEGQPRVTFLTGIDGVKQVYRDALTQDFYGLFNTESMYKAFGENLMLRIFGKDAHFRGKDLFVNNDSGRQYMEEVKQHDEYEIRLLPEGVIFHTDTIVYDDTIALFAYDDEKTIVRIENRNLANAFRAWHEALWSISGH